MGRKSELEEQNPQLKNLRIERVHDEKTRLLQVKGPASPRNTLKRSQHEIEKKWDAVVWLGDFNSRVEGYRYEPQKTKKGMKVPSEKESTFLALERGHYEKLVHND